MKRFCLFLVIGFLGGCSEFINRKTMQLPIQMVLTSSSERFILGGMEFSSREKVLAEITDIHERTGWNLELICFVLSESNWQQVVSFLNELNERKFVVLVVEKDISIHEVDDPVPLDEVMRLDNLGARK